MGYGTNPFNSEKGKNILKENFRLVFVADRKNARDIEANDLRQITGHFVDNTEQIINNIMKFSKGHRPILPANAFETGIYVCPHCLRRDFMNLWEYESLGYYQPGSMGTDPLNFQKITKGKGYKRNTYGSLARVKCNTVYSCSSCNATYGETPSYGKCDRCNGQKFHKVGSGKVSYAEHFTPSLDVEQLFSNPQQEGVLSVNSNIQYVKANISPNEQIVRSIMGMATAFEYAKNDMNLNSRSDYARSDKEWETFQYQIPSLNVAFSSKRLMDLNSTNCPAKPRIRQFPISPMRMFRWEAPPRFRCTYSVHIKQATSRWDNDGQLAKKLGTNYWCTTRDERGRQHGRRKSRRDDGLEDSMIPTITSPNPLIFNPKCQIQGSCVCGPYDPPGCAFQRKKYRGDSIYRLTLEMRPRMHPDESYQYSLYLPAKFSLQRYMEDLTDIPINQGTTELCPNDPTVEEAVKQIDCDELNKNDELLPTTKLNKKITVQTLIDDGRTDVVDIISKYAKGIVKDELSQLSLEGCSERGVLMSEHYQGWVDYSSNTLNAAGKSVPRYLFVNKKEQAGREWLAEYCKKLNDFPKGTYTFMDFAYTSGRNYYSRSDRHTRSADHLLPTKFIHDDAEEEQLLPVLAGTPRSISTFSGNESVFSKEFWRKLRGVKLKTDPGKIFAPIVINGDTSFFPTYFISKTKLPICTLNGQVTKLVKGAQKKLRATHTVKGGITYVDDSMMTVYTVMRCETCNGIFDAGGVLNYRSSEGWVDGATGMVTGKPRWYAQETFEKEVVHELADYPPPPRGPGKEWEPFTTSDGFRVCPNWGIDFQQKFGKAMLKGVSNLDMKEGGGGRGSMDVGTWGSGKSN